MMESAIRDLLQRTRLSLIRVIAGKSTKLECECSCGKITTVYLGNVKSGKTSSCGCLHLESVTKHGAHDTPLYAAWEAMKQRCLNPKSPPYPDYGGRGICIHADWVASFEMFAAHVRSRPSPEHSLDRIDNDGNYEPGNVRWATPSQQQLNRRPRRSWPARDYHGRFVS